MLRLSTGKVQIVTRGLTCGCPWAEKHSFVLPTIWGALLLTMNGYGLHDSTRIFPYRQSATLSSSSRKATRPTQQLLV